MGVFIIGFAFGMWATMAAGVGALYWLSRG